jgi:hypothetical protein
MSYLVIAALAVVLLDVRSARALCGDDVGGVRVPCMCGDVVVSDTRLLPDDPVVSGRCTGDGLFLRAPAGAESIRLDLAGLSLLGAQVGSGVHVIDGGTSGAVVVGGTNEQPGTIAGFGTGITGAARAVAEVSNLLVAGNIGDGIELRAAQTRLWGVAATRNGRDGLRISGQGADFQEVTASENGGYGARVRGASASGEVTTRANRRGELLGPRRSRGQARGEAQP